MLISFGMCWRINLFRLSVACVANELQQMRKQDYVGMTGYTIYLLDIFKLV